jgi:hypothetical protein
MEKVELLTTPSQLAMELSVAGGTGIPGPRAESHGLQLFPKQNINEQRLSAPNKYSPRQSPGLKSNRPSGRGPPGSTPKSSLFTGGRPGANQERAHMEGEKDLFGLGQKKGCDWKTKQKANGEWLPFISSERRRPFQAITWS